MRAVLNGEGLTVGVGVSMKKAKQNAAKSAMMILNTKENQGPAEKKAAGPVCQQNISKLNFRSCLNEHGQKNRAPTKPSRSTRFEPNNSNLVVFDDKEYPASSGTTKREAKEEAAKLVSSSSALCDDGASARDVCNIESKSVARTLSNHPKVQDLLSEEINTGNTPSEMTLNDTEIFSNKSQFESVCLLGEGGYGRVLKVKHKLLNKCYAMKIVRCREIGKALREAKALSDLEHLNIVRYHSCWIEDSGYQPDSSDNNSSSSHSRSSSDSPYQWLHIQMEFCDKTLSTWIDEKNMKKSQRYFIRIKESLIIMQQIVSGVEYIHSKKLIHRDLKPSNIMLGQDGKVKIGDFGLVIADNDDTKPMERTVKGTPSYMAPEQESEKNYDRNVDIFPLGLIYFELLWKMYTRHEKEKIWENIRKQELPLRFKHFIEEYIFIKSMLSAKPEDRPEASKVKADLEEYARRFDTEEIKRRGCRTK
ncbi:interferon-induced, double-stranded RNA-activated protein kinase-like [Embiotoca jacksoni]|uniref:interferon-induced, double-stranded RNA-activated protein kinase-like n=1 Tax=Embiotoca jacksoni TaxID=100190 RepID=UPI003703C196